MFDLDPLGVEACVVPYDDRHAEWQTGLEVINNFMLNSAEHESFSAHKGKYHSRLN